MEQDILNERERNLLKKIKRLKSKPISLSKYLKTKYKDVKDIDPADVDDDATTKDIASAEKNIMIQLKKQVGLGNSFKVEFKDKKKIRVPDAVANKAIKLYDKHKTSGQKGDFQRAIAKSYKDLLSVVKTGKIVQMEEILEASKRKEKENADKEVHKIIINTLLKPNDRLKIYQALKTIKFFKEPNPSKKTLENHGFSDKTIKFFSKNKFTPKGGDAAFKKRYLRGIKKEEPIPKIQLNEDRDQQYSIYVKEKSKGETKFRRFENPEVFLYDPRYKLMDKIIGQALVDRLNRRMKRDGYVWKLEKGTKDFVEELEVIQEPLDPEKHDVKKYISDFQKSTNPQFDGMSPEKRKEMAIAAYTKAKADNKNEAVDWESVVAKTDTERLNLVKKHYPFVDDITNKKKKDKVTQGFYHYIKNKDKVGIKKLDKIVSKLGKQKAIDYINQYRQNYLRMDTKEEK